MDFRFRGSSDHQFQPARRPWWWGFLQTNALAKESAAGDRQVSWILPIAGR